MPEDQSDDAHVRTIKQGVRVWNEWRDLNPKIIPCLAGAYLVDISLDGANLSLADLSGAQFGDTFDDTPSGWREYDADYGGHLASANLRGADLSGAYLYSARLNNADLSGAKLCGADLREAKLAGAYLRDADLTDADLSEASLGRTVFADVDLSVVKGLATINHLGPSTIGIDTIYKSRGAISDAFLRAAGVPDNFIAYARSLVGKTIEFCSCFISYSTEDQAFADRLYADLQANGVRCWFAQRDVRAGRKLYEQIDEAIRFHDRLLLLLSAASMASEWVKTEIATARSREAKEGRRVLFPVRLVDFAALRDWKCFDADTGKDSAREIREYFIPDFSRWKDHDSYQKAFERLLRDLPRTAKAEAVGGNSRVTDLR